MEKTKAHLRPINTERNLILLYWGMRLGIAFIWIWTAIVSWLIYPQSESMDWLRRLGLTHQTYLVFAGACLLDIVMGIASSLFASRKIWQLQFAIVTFYSIAISLWLPEFLIHPFGPITKNIAVLACLAYLAIVEEH